MKKLFLLLTLSLITMSFVYAQEEKELKFSQKIQDTFFGVKFGASSSDVIVAFENEELNFVEEVSSKNILVFTSKRPSYVDLTFGEKTWNFVRVYLSNDTFYQIEFAYTTEYKKKALDRFEEMLLILSSKYNMNESPTEDANTCKDYFAASKDKKAMTISYYKSENTQGKIRYYVNLTYVDMTLFPSYDEF